jgi:hypothetical protein
MALDLDEPVSWRGTNCAACKYEQDERRRAAMQSDDDRRK